MGGVGEKRGGVRRWEERWGQGAARTGQARLGEGGVGAGRGRARRRAARSRAGQVCIPAISVDFCSGPALKGTMCISSSPLGEGERCDSDFAQCPKGMMCWDDYMTGQEHCVRGWLHAGDSCYDPPNNPSVLCEPDLHCNLTTEMCEPNDGTLGGACPCQTGLTCGDDQKCHPG